MKIPFYLICVVCVFFYNVGSGQSNFREGFEKNDPVPKDTQLPLAGKLASHQAFLEKAQAEGDPLKALYGQLYLAYDHLYNQDYAAATEHLLKAQAIADQSGNPGWRGWVMHRQAIVSLRLKKTEMAREQYERAAALCGQAGDSLCVAESLEQVSLTYGKLFDFYNAERYHDIAMPLIEKYGGPAQLGAAYNNYGNINSWADRYAPAVANYERAIAIYKKLDRKMEMAKAMNNLADAYKYLHRYAEAEKILEECMRINRENNFLESLLTNYANASVLYDSMGNYREAFLYLHDFHYLKDSLAGAETQRQIAEMQIKYDSQQKELELEKSNNALEKSQRLAERQAVVLLLGLLMAGIGLWRWRLQRRQTQRELEKNRKNLQDMTRILIEKNQQLASLQKKSPEKPQAKTSALGDRSSYTTESADDPEVNIFDQQILTEADWASFKVHFENAYPGFLQRLRSAFPSMTDAEERLFLFIKLNLGTKEAAAILGISPISVKKTRNRLRKRLGLEEEINLEEFVRGF